MAGFVAANPLDGLALDGVIAEVDQSAVGQLGAGLEGDVEFAVAMEALIVQLIASTGGIWPASPATATRTPAAPVRRGMARASSRFDVAVVHPDSAPCHCRP